MKESEQSPLSMMLARILHCVVAVQSGPLTLVRMLAKLIR
jgi:hypothetical protein